MAALYALSAWSSEGPFMPSTRASWARQRVRGPHPTSGPRRPNAGVFLRGPCADAGRAPRLPLSLLARDQDLWGPCVSPPALGAQLPRGLPLTCARVCVPGSACSRDDGSSVSIEVLQEPASGRAHGLGTHQSHKQPWTSGLCRAVRKGTRAVRRCAGEWRAGPSCPPGDRSLWSAQLPPACVCCSKAQGRHFVVLGVPFFLFKGLFICLRGERARVRGRAAGRGESPAASLRSVEPALGSIPRP